MSDYLKVIILRCAGGGGIEIRDAYGNKNWIDAAAAAWRADHQQCPQLLVARRPDMPTAQPLPPTVALTGTAAGGDTTTKTK